ncbi:MAG: NTP transferase domain-containing protein, partial [Nitrososphaeraceae archaeon]|nr:NTP transferase domain-containing protein [Nitrososphaeraceae archaeon]
VMCGGKGSRMKKHSKTEKTMIRLGKRRMVEYIIDSLKNTKFFLKIVLNTTKQSPRTKAFLVKKYGKDFPNIEFCETGGKGYSLDLKLLLIKFSDFIIFFVPADLPLLSQYDINNILRSCKFQYPCNSIIIEKSFIENLGIKPSISFTYRNKDYCYSGITIFNPRKISNLENNIPERFIVQNQIGIAVNVNEKTDLEIVRRMMQTRNI